MQRDVSAYLDIAVSAPATLEFQIAVANQPGLNVSESLRFELDGAVITPRLIFGPHGTRIHKFDCGPGDVRVRYKATVFGTATPELVTEYDRALYLRPSRFAQSDQLLGFAAAEFGQPTAVGAGSSAELAERVCSWVGRRLRYVVGSSAPSDGAVETLLAGAGVCRDFTHLVVALLRAMRIPARLVSVYAPGLNPMDFHTVAEAYVDGAWRAFDATRLAPRSTMVRIATGRDTADTAFLDNHGGEIFVNNISVMATVAGLLPYDDHVSPVTVG